MSEKKLLIHYEKTMGEYVASLESSKNRRMTNRDIARLRMMCYKFADSYAADLLAMHKAKTRSANTEVIIKADGSNRLVRMVTEWCEMMEVNPDDVFGPSRKTLISMARQICQYKLCLYLGVCEDTFILIGNMWGSGRDRTTIRSSYYKIKGYISMRDPLVMSMMNLIEVKNK